MIRHVVQILVSYYLMTFSVTSGACPAFISGVHSERHEHGPCCLLKNVGDTVQELCRKHQEFLSCLKPLTEYQSSIGPFESEMRRLNCAAITTTTPTTTTTTTTTTTYNACDYKKCLDKAADSKNIFESCRNKREEVDCLDSIKKNNPACSRFKNDIDMHMGYAFAFIGSHCRAMTTTTPTITTTTTTTRTPSYTDCDYSRCTRNVANSNDQNKMCRSMREALNCLDMTTKNNTACSWSLAKNNIDKHRAKATSFIESYCSATTTPTINACNYTRCTNNVVERNDTNAMCKDVREALNCLDNTRKNNPACSLAKENIDKLKAKATRFIESYCSATITPTSSACDYKRCTSKVVRSNGRHEECRGMREAVKCLDTTTMNPACSSVKNHIDMHRANATRFIGAKCSAAAGLTSSLVFSLGLGILTYFLASLK